MISVSETNLLMALGVNVALDEGAVTPVDSGVEAGLEDVQVKMGVSFGVLPTLTETWQAVTKTVTARQTPTRTGVCRLLMNVTRKVCHFNRLVNKLRAITSFLRGTMVYRWRSYLPSGHYI